MLVGASVLIPIILAYTGILLLGVSREDGSRGLPLRDAGANSASSRWLWFVGLWAAGVAATGLVGLIIKLWLT